MKKELEQTLRDFYFSFAGTIAMFENCEKLCPIDTLMEMCETLAGIMAEQGAIIATLENMKSEKDWRAVRDEFCRPLTGERFYSMNLDAICDMMRLAKHMKDVSESKDELLSMVKQLKQCKELPPFDPEYLLTILDAIPRVKGLKRDE